MPGSSPMFHAAAFGIGGYATYLSVHWASPAVLACADSSHRDRSRAVACGRLRSASSSGCSEFYFAVVTLAFAELARLSRAQLAERHQRHARPFGTRQADRLAAGHRRRADRRHVRLGTCFALTCLLVAGCRCRRFVVRSWIGRNFAAIRLNEDLAQTLGISIVPLQAAGIHHCQTCWRRSPARCYGFYSSYIEPAYLSITQSLDVIAMTLLGGVGSILGPFVGAFLLNALPHAIDLSAEIAHCSLWRYPHHYHSRHAARYRRHWLRSRRRVS